MCFHSLDIWTIQAELPSFPKLFDLNIICFAFIGSVSEIQEPFK